LPDGATTTNEYHLTGLLKKTDDLARQYEALRQRLAQIGTITQG